MIASLGVSASTCLSTFNFYYYFCFKLLAVFQDPSDLPSIRFVRILRLMTRVRCSMLALPWDPNGILVEQGKRLSFPSLTHSHFKTMVMPQACPGCRAILETSICLADPPIMLHLILPSRMYVPWLLKQ